MENSLEVWEAVKKAPREQDLLILEGLLRPRLNDTFLRSKNIFYDDFPVSVE